MGNAPDAQPTQASDAVFIGISKVPNESIDAVASSRKGIAMKALVLRLAALALPIALFVAAAAPRLRW